MTKNINSANPKRKPWSLSEETRKEIQKLLKKKNKMSQRAIAAKFGVCTSTVNHLANPEAYYVRAARYREKTRARRLKRMRAYYQNVIKPKHELDAKAA